MRNEVIDGICQLAENDPDLYLITADLGFGVLEKFQKAFPKRFFNAGIAEQNMAAVATGLALEGKQVYIYSIGNFPTLRCLEQVRNLICYHEANVKIIATGGGFSYGTLGMTHHATEDLSIMRSLPNMRVYAPADAKEALACLQDMYNSNAPCYLRLARGHEPDQHEKSAKIVVDDINSLSFGEDVNILTTGTILSEGKKLKDLLSAEGLSVGLHSLSRLKPFEPKLLEPLNKSKIIVTMEDHNIIGGLGSLVSESFDLTQSKPLIIKLGLPDCYSSEVGIQEYLRGFYGFSAKEGAKKILECWRKYFG